MNLIIASIFLMNQNMFSLFLQGVIIVHEVYEDGAAFKDGRLVAGDQILKVVATLNL